MAVKSFITSGSVLQIFRDHLQVKYFYIIFFFQRLVYMSDFTVHFRIAFIAVLATENASDSNFAVSRIIRGKGKIVNCEKCTLKSNVLMTLSNHHKLLIRVQCL